MLYGGDTPQTESVGLFDDVAPAAQGMLEQRGIPADGPSIHSLGLGFGWDDRIHLDNDFDQFTRLAVRFLWVFMAEVLARVTRMNPSLPART